MRLFPDAKIINIERHGVDVAASLNYRSSAALAKSSSSKFRKKIGESIFYKKGVYTDSLRCLDLDSAFDLWVDYLCQSEINRERVVPDSYLSLKFEDLVGNSRESIEAIANFVEIECDSYVSVLDDIRESRGYAYQKRDHLREFASEKRESLARFGYSG
jgi:hypothetical protein